MTDTTDHQAVTVAQEDVVVALREINEMAAGVGDIFPNDATAVVAIGQTASAALDVFDARIVGNAKAYVEAMAVVAKDPPAALSRLASVSSASADAVTEAAKPWADYHGDLPDYDHPLRPVFESGIQYTVELLAKQLDVAEWVPCDGTEEFDGDLGGTLMNIVLEAMPKDKHGDAIWPRDLPGHAASPEPVPATNQAGEVALRAGDRVKFATGEAGEIIRCDYVVQLDEPDGSQGAMGGSVGIWTVDASELTRAAFATQPATSQEGEACEPMAHLGVRYTVAGVMAEMLAVGTADDEGQLAEDWPLDCRADVDRWQAVIRPALAATPKAS